MLLNAPPMSTAVRDAIARNLAQAKGHSEALAREIVTHAQRRGERADTVTAALDHVLTQRRLIDEVANRQPAWRENPELQRNDAPHWLQP